MARAGDLAGDGADGPAGGRGVHRTFLVSDGSGKAPVAKPKMMLGTAGVIRLAELLGAGLGLAEGIETALSCTQLIGWGPVWAAGSRGMIERFPLLADMTLNIFADADDSGEGLKAARCGMPRVTLSPMRGRTLG